MWGCFLWSDCCFSKLSEEQDGVEYMVCIYKDHSPGLGVRGRNKINNSSESWACEFYYLKEGHNTLLRAGSWKRAWGWMACKLSGGVNLGRLHVGGEMYSGIRRPWGTSLQQTLGHK